MIEWGSPTWGQAGSNGMCMCGCGQRAPLARQTNRNRGLVKGKPQRFVRGHQKRAFRADQPNWRLDPVTGCWVWQGLVNKGGYGYTNSPLGKLAHRVSYQIHVGPIPNGLGLDHLCNNRKCVNPDHLEPVTQKENVRRAWARREARA